MAGPQQQVEGPASLVAARILNAVPIDLNSLEGIDTLSIPNRSVCYVKENESLYRFFEESVAAPAPPGIVQPAPGGVVQPGRWILETADAASLGGSINSFGAADSIPGDNTATPLTFVNIEFGAPPMVDIAGNRLVVQQTGIYHLSLFGIWANGLPTIDRSLGLLPAIGIVVDGGSAAELHADFLRGTVTALLRLTAGAVITATASQGTGASPAINMLARLGAQLLTPSS